MDSGEVKPKRELLYRLNAERVRQLFRWSGAKIFTVPTVESVRQFRRILEATQVTSIVEIFAGSGYVASILSTDTEVYKCTDNYLYPIATYYPVRRMGWEKAIETAPAKALIVCFLPHKPAEVVPKIVQACKGRYLLLLVYKGLNLDTSNWRRLRPTYLTVGDFWNPKTQDLTGKYQVSYDLWLIG